MVVIAADCRNALVNARWAILPISCTGFKTLLSPCRGSVSDLLGSFQSGGALSLNTH